MGNTRPEITFHPVQPRPWTASVKLNKIVVPEQKMVETDTQAMAALQAKFLTEMHDTVVHKFHEMVTNKVIDGYDAQVAAGSMLHDIANAFEHDYPELMHEQTAFKLDNLTDKVETFAEYLHGDFIILE